MFELERLGTLSDEDLAGYVDDESSSQRIPGFGHRFHSEDPRAVEIFTMAAELGFNGHFVTLARRLETMLREQTGAALNIAGANAAILLDLDFDPHIAQLFIVPGRSTMFAAVYLERLTQERGSFPRIEVVDILDPD